MFDLVVVALNSPIRVALYKDYKLYKELESNQKSSEILPDLIGEFIRNYKIDRILYANGPGSFMAIKLAYIFLKTISITKNIPLFAIDGFYFSQNCPIKANNSRFFIKNGDRITVEKVETKIDTNFRLPNFIDFKDFSLENEPLYILPAI